MISPLGTVVEVLLKVRQDARIYGTRLAKNEAATRAALIDPVLRVLGWDLGNPIKVEFERSFMDTRVDYALSNCQDQVKVIVEAKALGGKLDDKKIMISLVTYAFTYGLQDIFLTDGLIWEHFYNFKPGEVAANKTMDLSKDDLVECAEYFVHRLDAAKYWPASEEERPAPKSDNEKQMEELTKSLINLQAELVEIKSKLPKEKKPRRKNTIQPVQSDAHQDFKTLSELTERLTGQTPPSALRLPDGKIIPINTWRAILLECCKYVLANHPNLPIPLPDKAGKKINLIGFTPHTTRGVKFEKMQYNGKTVYVHLNYDSNHCVTNAIYILGYLPSEYLRVPAAVAL